MTDEQQVEAAKRIVIARSLRYRKWGRWQYDFAAADKVIAALNEANLTVQDDPANPPLLGEYVSEWSKSLDS